VDPKTHARFLTYLESYEYFRRPDIPKLAREEFIVLDTELRALIAKEQKKVIAGEEPKRLRELRKILFRD
jgi:hypothetical protein